MKLFYQKSFSVIKIPSGFLPGFDSLQPDSCMYGSNQHRSTGVQTSSINIYYYNSNLIQSAESHENDRHGSSDQTRRRASSLILRFTPVNETYSGISDQVTFIMINVLYTLPTLSKNFEIKYLGSSVQRLFTKEKHILKELSLIFFFAYYKP